MDHKIWNDEQRTALAQMAVKIPPDSIILQYGIDSVQWDKKKQEFDAETLARRAKVEAKLSKSKKPEQPVYF